MEESATPSVEVVVPVDNPPENETTEELSKRQKKKLLKLQKFEANKKNMRKNEKEKRKLKRQLAKEQGVEIFNGPSRKALKLNKIENNPADISVAIDLSFDDLMIDKDLSSCAKQLCRIYTNNRRAKRPIPVHFTGLQENGKLYEKLERNEGWKNWDIFKHSESYIDLFEKKKIIYLTSESDTVLTEELEKGAVYIVGGLVDHNHHKFLTHELAQKKGIRTARLPLSEHIVMKTRSVLTINQVFDIILGVSEGKSWKEILLEVLPQRKNITAKSDIDAPGESSKEIN